MMTKMVWKWKISTDYIIFCDYIMNVKKIINRALIAIDAYIRYLTQKKQNINSKTVYIIFQQVFGDSIVIQNSLWEYEKIFTKADGWNIKMLVRPAVLEFMKVTVPLPEDIEYEELDYTKFLEDYVYYKEIVNKYRNKAKILIIPGTSMSAEVFSAVSNAERKIGLVKYVDVRRPFAMALFNRIAYTERVRPEKEDMMLQNHRRLLHYLGDTSYKAKLPELLIKDRMISEEHYCVMCPGASKMEKCWPIERFAKVIDYIVEKFQMNVHLCGATDEVRFEEILLKSTKYPERVISHIGKLSFSDWSSIIQYADLVVGNDSATMHLAAASRRKSVCIAGVYDKYLFFPYRVDELDESDRLPITLIKDMPCEWCRTIGYDSGFGNQDCAERIRAGKCSICIDAITVQEVTDAIDALVNE